MGQLIHKVGNLFETQDEIIGHGVNCRGGFGSGVAGQMRKQHPDVFLNYSKKFVNVGWHLGEVQFVLINGNQWVANMATQDSYGGPGVHVNYPALKTCFDTVLHFCEQMQYKLSIPKIGAGLAGGDWATIEDIIRDLLQFYDVKVTCYSLE